MTDPPLLVLWAPLLWLRHRARIIYWCHDVYPDLLSQVAFPIAPWIMKILRLVKYRALKACAQVVALGPCMQDYLQQHYGVPATKLKIIANWTNANCTTDAVELTEISNTLTDKFVVLYAGNLGKLHPYQRFLATAQALQDDTRFHFIVAGYGQGRTACEAAAKGLANITFMSFLNDASIQSLQQKAQVHWASLSPAATQLAVPVKTMAAFAAGRPLIWDGNANATTAQMLDRYQAGKSITNAETAVQQLHHWYQDMRSYAAACQGARSAHQDHAPERQWQRWQNLLNTNT